LQEPQIKEDIDVTSDLGTQVHLTCPNRYASIYYTLDGSLPTRHFDNVHVNNNEKKKKRHSFLLLLLFKFSNMIQTQVYFSLNQVYILYVLIQLKNKNYRVLS